MPKLFLNIYSKSIVVDMNVEDIFYNNGSLNRNKLKENWVKENLTEVYENVINCDVDIKWKNFSQRLYHYFNDLKNYPICEYCGSLNKRWKSFTTGYKSGCCKSCAIQLSRPKAIENRKKNTLIKYKVDHTSQLESVKRKREKTNIKKYGFKSPAMDDKVKSKIVKTNNLRYNVDYPLQNEKIYENLKNHFLEKYKVDNPLKSKIVKEKVRKTNLKRYGYESYSSTDEFKKFISDKFFEKSLSQNPDHIERISVIDDDFEIKCNKCNEISSINRSLFYLRLNRYKTEVCPNCNPLYNVYVSSYEISLSEFLTEHNIDHIKSYRDKYEIDIFIPDLKIGIEINGIYWHSELFKDKNYHLMKKEYFKDKGIDIIQIWEDDWLYKNEIVRSVILSKLNLNKKVYARKCKISEVKSKDVKKFLNKNHLQGFAPSSVNYGLYYKDELVSLMTFSKRTFIKNEDYELVRFCNKLNTNVVGGASKLLNHFIRNNNFKSIVSYARCDYTSIDDNLYQKIGFKFLKHSGLSYYWCKGNNRFNRYNFRKDKLVKKGFDENKSESEIMYEQKFIKCWDSGNFKFVYT